MVRTASNSAPGLIYHPEREKRAGEGEETACRVTTGEHHQSESKKKKFLFLSSSPLPPLSFSCPAAASTAQPAFRCAPKSHASDHAGSRAGTRDWRGLTRVSAVLSLSPSFGAMRLRCLPAPTVAPAPCLALALAKTCRAMAPAPSCDDPRLARSRCCRLWLSAPPRPLDQWPPQPPNRAAPHQCLPLRLRHLATLALNDCPCPFPRLPPPLNLNHPRFSHPHFARPVCNTRNGKCGQELWAAGDWRRQRRTGLRPSRRRVWRQGPSFTLRLVAS